MDSTALPTYQNLPTQLRQLFISAIRCNPVEWLLPPQNDEVFDSFDHRFARLQAYALGQGFAIIKGKSWSAAPQRQYFCIHHGSKTRNDRRLEEVVERDSEGEITSRRRIIYRKLPILPAFPYSSWQLLVDGLKSRSASSRVSRTRRKVLKRGS